MTRRHFVTASVAVGTAIRLQQAAQALGLAAEANVCRLVAEQEVGPYYIADEIFRSTIAEGKPGVPLALRIAVLDAQTCKPLPNAAIDVWHCDALGLYSGFTDQNPRGPGGPPPDFDSQDRRDSPVRNHPGPPERMGPPPQHDPTDKLTFLRGIQLTDGDGVVNFHTVFPGFYMGRTNHIHFKVRLGGQLTGSSYAAGHTSHTGQIFFPEDLAITLMEHEPYKKHKIHRTTQAEDGIYRDQQGEVSVARVTSLHPGDFAAGLHAELIAAVDPAANPAPVQRRGGPGRPPPGGPDS